MEPVVYTQPHYQGGRVLETTPMLAKVALDIPYGLDYLTKLDQLLVKQHVDRMEGLTHYEKANKYKVLNSLGQKVYDAIETTEPGIVQMCQGPMRPFDIKIVDTAGRVIIHFNRRFRLFLQRLEVYAPPGMAIGYVKSICNWSRAAFDIQDASEQTVLRIEGMCCCRQMCSCCGGEKAFKVLTMDGSEIGRITKQWAGLSTELFTDADNYGISFPLDLDVKYKATLLGACFLIDFLFFEQDQVRIGN